MKRVLIIFIRVLPFLTLFAMNCFVFAEGENCKEVKYDCQSKFGDIDESTCKTKTVCDESDGGTEWSTSVGINLSDGCLMWMGKWCFDYEKIIWIDKEQDGNITATSIAQDVIFSATYMVGTVLTIVIIRCGLGYIFASRDGKDVSAYKKWLISAAIWAVLVWWAYAIVRLIQYIAKG